MSKTITVGRNAYAGDTNVAIQKAVDDVAAAGGGEVIVPAGTYMMHDALHLRSGVRVVGRKGAILKKVPSVTSPLAGSIGYGHYEFIAAEPEKFRPGMGVHILDKRSGGFYTTVATITARKGSLFYIDRMLNHDYTAANGGKIVSVYPIVEGTNVREAAVIGLTLDGNYPKETFSLNGCRGGGVFLIGSQRVRIDGVEVVRYHGDAVSFQQCADIIVENCYLHDNTGHGLHPGSGSVRYVMRGVRSVNNGQCGIYYCLRTTHSILANCEFTGNGRSGISIGERDTDHIIRRNTIRGNGRWGVLFRGARLIGGDRVLLEGNTIGGNCTAQGGEEIFINEPAGDLHLVGNAIDPGKNKAVTVEKGCKGIHLSGNTVAGKPLTADHVTAAGGVSYEAGKVPPLGPDAMPDDGALHLNIPELPKWQEPK